MYRNRNKIVRALALALALALTAVRLSAGDAATFVDLGFSPDGVTYMFAQYGVQSGALKPWAEIFVVDVPRNNFVPGGRLSLVGERSVVPGQDGDGALYRLLAQNVSLAERYKVDFLFQGQPLYVSPPGDGAPGAAIEFRDFDGRFTYRATLVSTVEDLGATVRSSFHINLERQGADGSRKSYTVGTPQLKRPDVISYRIRKVMIAPKDGSMILVIEMRKQNGKDIDVRYMVEAVRL